MIIFVETKEKVMAKEVLTLSQEIDIAMIKLNYVQADVVQLLQEAGISMNTSKFSVKKKYADFTEQELKGLNTILNTKF